MKDILAGFPTAGPRPQGSVQTEEILVALEEYLR
jgi:hypothetical protein